jgi:hypothetical protein
MLMKLPPTDRFSKSRCTPESFFCKFKSKSLFFISMRLSFERRHSRWIEDGVAVVAEVVIDVVVAVAVVDGIVVVADKRSNELRLEIH